MAPAGAGTGYLLTGRHRAKREEFRRFAASALVPAGESFPRDNLNRLAARGYMGLPVPTEWGGAGEDFLTYILLVEEVSRVCASTGVILAVHTSVGTFPLLYYGSAKQKRRFLPGLARGELLGAFALTESGAGSDAAALCARARLLPGEEGYILNGAKIFITSAGEADLYTVFATVDPDRGKRGITAFLVEKDTPGLEIGSPEKKMGLHGSATAELLFSDLALPVESRLGREGEGFAIALSLLAGGRIGIGAQAAGICRAACAETAALLAAREDCSRDWPLLPAWRETLASLWTRLEAARLLVYRAAALKQKGADCSREAAMAKLFASDLAVAAATRCLDIFGLEGAAGKSAVERCFRDAKATQIYEGSNQVQRLVIARSLAF